MYRKILFESVSSTISLKGYLRDKTILCHKAAIDAQLMDFLFEEKIMFRSQDIEIFVFL